MMGVSGSGKTSVGRALAGAAHLRFLDADKVHPSENVAKMRSGQPLTDEDRGPWLAALAQRLETWVEDGGGGVLACSALKRAYRDRLRTAAPGLRLVYLKIGPKEAGRRINARRNHFMPASLNGSQFDTLEEPDADEAAVIVVSEGGVRATAARALAALRAGGGAEASTRRGADADG